MITLIETPNKNNKKQRLVSVSLLKKLNNLKVYWKILLVALMPILGVCVLGAILAWGAYKDIQETEQFKNAVEVAIAAGPLVHNLQIERGMSAGYLGSQGRNFSDKLPKHRKKNADPVLKKFFSVVEGAQAQGLPKSFNAQVQGGLDLLSQIKDYRENVTSQKLSVAKAVGYYSGINAQLIGLVDAASKLTSNVELAADVSSYGNFLQSKERAGIERAVGSVGFGKGAFSAAMKQKLTKLIAEQDVYLKVYLSQATDEFAMAYQQAAKDKSFSEVVRMRQIAFSDNSEAIAETQASYWFEQQTKRINKLKELEDQLNGVLLPEIETYLAHVELTLLEEILFSLAIVGIAIGAALFTARTITNPLNDSIRAMDKIAKGDLAIPIVGRDRLDELGGIAKALELFKKAAAEKKAVEEEQQEENVRRLKVGEQVNNSVREMRSAVGEISSGNLDLSQRTETQAANVEETTATVQQITENISANGQRMNEVEQIVHQARNKADEGSHAARQAVSAMSEITESSEKITEIIGVIDEIAFQTNLLALNAAVEAARAGEQGRGFAVVASEVRSLAGRSADAAKEIKDLITENVEKIHSGAQHVRETGDLLEGIASQVVEAENALSELSGGVREQVTQMSEINSAVVQVDQITQQNAALVEQAAAASKALEDQMESVLKVIG